MDRSAALGHMSSNMVSDFLVQGQRLDPGHMHQGVVVANYG